MKVIDLGKNQQINTLYIWGGSKIGGNGHKIGPRDRH